MEMGLVKFLCPKCEAVLYYDEDSCDFVCLECKTTLGELWLGKLNVENFEAAHCHFVQLGSEK